MQTRYTFGLVALFLGILVWPTVSWATHVRAGEITTVRTTTASLTYRITLTMYFDEVRGKPAADQADTYTICFGDGTSAVVNRSGRKFINGGTSSVDTYTIVHTYPGPGTYTIGAQAPNRNAGTNNLPPPTDQIIFYVSTTILINPALLTNSTPVMLNPPLDSARVGQKFCHNPAAYDPDGDSLAFRLSIPKQGINGSICSGPTINGYQDPTRFSTSSEAGGTPTFTIDPKTGLLCWDAPGQTGQFNFAFIVEEWRNGVLIGEVTRDMQIIVVDIPNKRPLINGTSLCVQAGTFINQPITATDPDGNRVYITAFGGPFNRDIDNTPLPAGQLVPPAYATLVNGGVIQNQPATATFSWQTNCNQIRTQPYDVTLKVNDVPGRIGTQNITSLVSFATLSIKIIGPAVQNLTARATAVASGRAIQLNWSAYNCGPAGSKLAVYRREGCNPNPPSPCTTGAPAGYKLLDTLSLNATSYTDTSTLRRGISYSYVIVALYADRYGQFTGTGGASVPSAQACLQLPLLAPVLTQVTVDSTNSTPGQTGQITVRWTRPLGLTPGDLGAPYQYRLYRATGLNGTNFTPVATINTNLQPGVVDTVYVDRGTSTSALNTAANAYRYQLEFYYTAPGGQLTRLDVTDPASSVRLSATPVQRQIQLSWQANTPWSNDNQTHLVFRSRSGPRGPFNQIAAVPVQGPNTYVYTDDGTDKIVADGNTSRPLSADSSYCYRVLTVGRYPDAPLSGIGLLLNYSQVICASPVDTTRPCPPRLGLDSLNCANLTPESFCNQTTFSNRLRWQATIGPTCDPNIASYTLYYNRCDGETPTKLTSIPAPTTTFEHTNLTTVAGCYYVTAVSARGLESQPSNRVCNDVCPYLALPNVFTPNGDGKNDVFEPLRCPRFLESIELVVYNRWGAKVYSSTTPTLAWDGKSSGGVDLPSGLYYYQVSARFAQLNCGAPPTQLKGWVQIIREGVSMR